MTKQNGAIPPTEPTSGLPVCDKVAVVELFELVSHQIPDAETRNQLYAHIEECPTCTRWYQNARIAFESQTTSQDEDA